MNISLIILAGGSGERIKVFKPLIKLNGESIIRIILKKFIDKYNEILIVVREKWQKEVLEEDLKILNTDITRKIRYVFDSPLTEGPLAAIYTGVLNSNFNTIAVLPSDTPFINSNIHMIMMKYLDDGYEAVVPIWPNGFLEPLTAIYLKEPLLKALDKVLSLNEKRVQSILKMLNVNYVDVYRLSSNPEKEFFNINTLEDLMRALNIMKHFEDDETI